MEEDFLHANQTKGRLVHNNAKLTISLINLAGPDMLPLAIELVNFALQPKIYDDLENIF